MPAEPVVFIRLLGPFELLTDAEPVTLARRPAVLLAVLALRANTPVSYGALSQLLWSPMELPENPRRTVQTYASRLREVLGREAVVAQGDGLRLDLDPDHVDLHRFRRLAARPATSGNDELRALNEALDLWAGAPLSGLPSSMLEDAEGPALLDEVLSVVERAHALRLQLAELDDALIASMRHLTSQHPWRERSWCHLMLALYRTGHQAEAFATFARLVTVLRDDLGIDPGAEATQLHQRMLAGDQELMQTTRPAVPSAAPMPAPPAQVPAATPSFVGRRSELAALGELLSRPADRVRVAAVSGPAGVGKTTTTLEAAHQVRAWFPDGQLFAEGTSGGAAVPARDVLGAFLRDLGVAASDVAPSLADRATMFRSICAQRRLLIVIDDAHSAQQVTSLLPGTGECAVLVTSRRRLAVPADLSVDLDEISAADSHELLAQFVGSDRLGAEPEASAAIVEACAGSPLALRIIGGRLATRPTWPIGYLSERLLGPERLAEMRLDGESVRAALDATVSTLDQPSTTRFAELGGLPAEFVDVDSAAAMWAVDRTEARELLEQLCDVRLLEPSGPECYSWHGLIGGYLREQPPRGHHDRNRRALRQAIASLANARDRFRPGDRPHQPIVTAIIGAAEPGGVIFGRRSDVHTWVHPRTVLIIELAREGLAAGAEHAVEAAALAVLIDAVLEECCTAGNMTEDLLRAVTTMSLPPAAAHFVAAAWHNLATAFSAQGHLADAQDAAEHAIGAWRRLGDDYGEAIMLNNLASQHGRKGDYATAVEVMDRCIASAEVLPAILQARCQRTLAEFLALEGDADGAIRRLAIAGDLNAPEPGSIDAYDSLMVDVLARIAAGDVTTAISAAETALTSARQMRSVRQIARTTVLLARARRLAGHDSLEVATEAVQLFVGQVHRDSQTQGEALAELAHAHQAAGDIPSARACVTEVARLISIAGLDGTPWAGALLAPLHPLLDGGAEAPA